MTDGILHFSKKMESIEVTDVIGTLLLKETDQDVIDVSTFKPGVYFAKTEKGVAKVVKE